MVFLNINLLQQSKKSINFDYDKQQQVHEQNSYYPNPETTEIGALFGGQLIVVR